MQAKEGTPGQMSEMYGARGLQRRPGLVRGPCPKNKCRVNEPKDAQPIRGLRRNTSTSAYVLNATLLMMFTRSATQANGAMRFDVGARRA